MPPNNWRRIIFTGAYHHEFNRVTSRCGFVAIVGAPNAGKSTCCWNWPDQRQTVHRLTEGADDTVQVAGIFIRDGCQVLLVDTPGIFRPRRKLDRAMVAAAWTGAADADLALLLVDAKAGATSSRCGRSPRASGRRAGAAGWCWNKTDLIPAQSLLPLIASLTALAPFEETFMVSAGNGDGVSELSRALAAAVPEGPFREPLEDDLTDLPDRLLAAETVREQIFLQTHDEVPYAATVETESFKERPDGSVRIEVTIYVARPGHKAILIGEKGSKVRDIGARARRDLAGLLERPVHLFLNVKERAGWDEEGARLRAIGLDDPGT